MTWNEARLQTYIDDLIEESLTLEYKAAEAFERTDWKSEQITKDASAMANSNRGQSSLGLTNTVSHQKHIYLKALTR